MQKIATTGLFLLVLSLASCNRLIFSIDEHWICNIKTSCVDCLRLNHCSWCLTDNICFSPKLKNADNFCKNNTVLSEDYGLSFDGNAECACAGGRLEEHCVAPGAVEQCSGRGTCQCGRCVCNPPDEQFPTKIIIGEYCEFDNFSCDGPDCDEGPYPLSPLESEHDPTTFKENSSVI